MGAKNSEMEDDALIIREANYDDIEAIYQIESESFGNPWSKTLLANEIQSDSSLVLCAVIEDTIVGFGSLMEVYDEIHITNLAVASDHRGKGIGRRLLSELINAKGLEQMKDVILEVRISNTSAIALYSSFGFEPLGIRKKYYEDEKEDALVMRYALTDR